MPDDPTGQAVGIIGALSQAGLLAAAPRPGEPTAGEIIGALSQAGLFQIARATPEPPPLEVVPAIQVGDKVSVFPVRRIARHFTARDDLPSSYQFVVTQNGDDTSYYALFPPNDDSYIEEIDKILAAGTKPQWISAYMEITKVITNPAGSKYHGELLSLTSNYPFQY